MSRSNRLRTPVRHAPGRRAPLPRHVVSAIRFWLTSAHKRNRFGVSSAARGTQMTSKSVHAAMLSVSAAALLSSALVSPVLAQAPQIDADDIAGTVMGASGPEAGVWVIAETRDLPTRYIKIVATDDQGRYLIPDLPARITTSGCAAMASSIRRSRNRRPASSSNLNAVAAPNEAAAAEYYPAIYWYSMLKIPEANLFPGTGANGNGIPVDDARSGPVAALPEDRRLQLLPPDRRQVRRARFPRRSATSTPAPKLGSAASSRARRAQLMVNGIGNFDTGARARPISAIGPIASPRANCRSRSRRVRRASSATSSSRCGTGTRRTGYLHDEISTDRRNPTLNANGLIYGSPEASSDFIPWLDPVDNKAGLIKTEWRDAKTPTTKSRAACSRQSPYWGTEAIWDSHTDIHNPMDGREGPRLADGAHSSECERRRSARRDRIIRPRRCSRWTSRAVSSRSTIRQTKKATMIDLCFTTHHLQFDKDGMMWFSSGNADDRSSAGST